MAHSALSKTVFPTGTVDLRLAALHTAEARATLAALVEADEAASKAGDCRWQFALEVELLLAAGASASFLRLLIRGGWIEHRQEVTRVADPTRKFLPLENLSLPKRCCLSITERGQLLAQREILRPSAPVDQIAAPILSDTRLAESPAKPDWNAQRRELRYTGQLVKAYRQPAKNQERVLTAFQTAGWPDTLDDPLPPVADQDAKRRLHHTIQKLNQAGRRELVRFRGDGTGRGICWEPGGGHIPTADA